MDHHHLELMAEPQADRHRTHFNGQRVGDPVPEELEQAGQVGHVARPLVQ